MLLSIRRFQAHNEVSGLVEGVLNGMPISQTTGVKKVLNARNLCLFVLRSLLFLEGPSS